MADIYDHAGITHKGDTMGSFLLFRQVAVATMAFVGCLAADQIWIDAAHFSQIGNWVYLRTLGCDALRGAIDRKPRPRERAIDRTVIALSNAGRYRLWVRAKDYAQNQPATRTFKVSVNGVESPVVFGTHRRDGFAWQDGGIFDLPSGEISLELVDSSSFYAMVHRLLLTDEPGFTPQGEGGRENARHLRAAPSEAPEADGIELDAGFPGGNIILVRRVGDEFLIRQDVRDTMNEWFYWCFRVKGAAGRTLRFRFVGTEVLGPMGPGVSEDGLHWRWLGPGAPDRFAYTLSNQATWFSFGMPYTEASLNAFLGRLSIPGAVERSELCRSRAGRSVELLSFGGQTGEIKRRVLLTARHHACEMMASYVLEGVIEGVLARSPEGEWLRRNVQFLAVPFVDKDGVEQGDQGKMRAPRDHNQDYGGAPHLYPEIAAIEKLVSAKAAWRATIDLHCPDKFDSVVFQWGLQDPRHWALQKDFGAVLEQAQVPSLPYRASNDTDNHVEGWTLEQARAVPTKNDRWMAARLDGLSTTLEIPYATAQGTVVDQESARAFGRRLALALERYLKREP